MPQGIALHIPFPSRISPDFGRAQACHLDWPRGFGLLPTPAAELRHLRGNYPDVAARFHPGAQGDDLDLGVDQQSWYFIFDDVFDGERGTDVAEVRRITRSVAARLDTAASPHDPPIVRAFADLWRRSRIGMSRSWVNRAAASWRAYLSGYVTEAVNRTRLARPSFDEHLAVRAATIGVAPVLDLAERVGHYECPQRLLDSPLMRRLRRIATEIVILDNDIVSVEKEESCGDLNLVLLQERARGQRRESSIADIARMIRDRSEAFIAGEKQLPELYNALDLSAAEREAAERYRTDGLRSLMRGAYDWDQKAGRYTPEFIGSSECAPR